VSAVELRAGQKRPFVLTDAHEDQVVDSTLLCLRSIEAKADCDDARDDVDWHRDQVGTDGRVAELLRMAE
jgi:hypothetical protein